MKNLIRNLISVCITTTFITLSIAFIYANNNLGININERLGAEIFKSTTNEDAIDIDKNFYEVNDSTPTIPILPNETTSSNINATSNIINKNDTSNAINNNSESNISTISTTDTTYEAATKTTKNIKTNYFSNSLFIGDSRTEGLRMYCPQDGSVYFSAKSLDTYKIFDTALNVENLGLYYLEILLLTKKFDKVYICLGINNIGSNLEKHLLSYKTLIEKILATQPDARIYIQSNLHITKSKSASSNNITNENIDAFNNLIKNFDNGSNIFYVDINEAYDNENHTLNSEYTSDGVHIKPQYYNLWMNTLIDNIR